MGHPALFEDLLGPVETRSKSRPAPPNLRALGGAGTREMAIVGDAYEGASTLNRELAMWQPASRSADNDILPQKRMSDARVRDTLRNDAYVRAGSVIHQDNIVGGAFTLNAKPMTKLVMGQDDATWEGEFQEEVEAKFTLWAESTDNWPDAARRMSLTQMVRQAVGQYVATGEVLAVAEWAREDAFLRPFNTAVRMIDLDRLSTPLDKASDRTVIGGVQVDGRHIPQGYYIRKAHPTDYMSLENYQWEYVPRTKPWGRVQAIHMYEQMRPYQTRGISDIVAGLKEIRQTKTYRETVLQNAVVNATYAASIESDLDTNAIFQRLGGGNLGVDDFDEAVGNYIGGYLGAIDKYIGASNQFQIGGVRIPHLPPGSKLQLRPAGKNEPLGNEFEQSLLRYIAAILGISYEQLSKDVSQTNYSSYRAAMGETWKFMQSRKSLVADRLAPSPLTDIIDWWEDKTGFKLEFAEYRSIYNRDVNYYVAIKPNGKGKRKGSIANHWHPDSPDYDPAREQMKKNPKMTIIGDAVLAFLRDGTPIEKTIRECQDVRGFLTVIKATGGATWRDGYLGKVVRYYWSTDGESMIKVKAHPKTGNRPKVPETEGCRPLMTLPKVLPADIDYARYVETAEGILKDIGYYDAPTAISPMEALLRRLQFHC